MFSIIDLYICAIRNTIFTLSIGTYLLTILLLKFEIVPSTTSSCFYNIAVCMANSVGPDQMCSTASDLDLNCL